MNTTTDEFSNPEGTKLEPRRKLLFSFDQEIGEFVGLWIRIAWRDDKAAINYDTIYTGGINLNGSLWKRVNDNIGLGYGYLNGGNREIDRTQVFEGYYRFVLNEYFAFTADVQYMRDDYKDRSDFEPKGVILGFRATAEF